MMRTVSECDICKRIIVHKEKYITVLFKQKGQNGNRKTTRTICNNCILESRVLTKIELIEFDSTLLADNTEEIGENED